MMTVCFVAGIVSFWDGTRSSACAQSSWPDKSSLNSPVTVKKVLPSSVELGQTFDAMIVVENRSTNPVEKVTVIEERNSGMKILGSTPKATVTENRLIWRLGRMEPGQKRNVKCRCQIDATLNARKLQTRVHAVFQAFVSSDCVCKITAPSLQLDVKGPETIFVGQRAELKIVLKNNASAAASGLILESSLDDKLIHRFGSELEYSIGTLKPGQSRVVPLAITPKSVGLYSIALRIKGPESAPVTKTRKVKVVPSPIRVIREAPFELYPQVIGAFRFKITNQSTRALDGVEFAIHLPNEISFVGSPLKMSYDDATRVLRWNLGKLTPGASRDVIWNGSVNESGEVSLRTAITVAGDLLYQSQIPIQVRPISALNTP